MAEINIEQLCNGCEKSVTQLKKRYNRKKNSADHEKTYKLLSTIWNNKSVRIRDLSREIKANQHSNRKLIMIKKTTLPTSKKALLDINHVNWG